MTLHRFTWMSIILAGLVAASLAVPVTHGDPADDKDKAPAAAAANTEDIVYMEDGRELHGKIVSETPTQIVFDYVDRKSNLKSRMTLDKDKITTIHRNVELA